MLFQSNWQKRIKKNNLRFRVRNGGAGSGNFGHVGRPGFVGGSGDGKGEPARIDPVKLFVSVRKNEIDNFDLDMCDPEMRGCLDIDEDRGNYTTFEDGKLVKLKNLKEYYQREKNKQVRVYAMAPMEYVKTIVESEGSPYDSVDDVRKRTSKEGIEQYVAKFKKGEKTAVPYITYGRDGEYVGQEGFHRAFAAEANGNVYIPVMISMNYDGPKPRIKYGRDITDGVERYYQKSSKNSVNENNIARGRFAMERNETHSLAKMAPYGFCNGGLGSGNFGHVGRPGMVGGSGKGFSASMRTKSYRVGDEISYDIEGGRGRGIIEGFSGRVAIVDVDGQKVRVPFDGTKHIKMERNVEDIKGYNEKRSAKEIQTEGQKKAVADLAAKIDMSDSVRAEYEKHCSEECAKEISKNVDELKSLGINVSYYSLGKTLENSQGNMGRFSVSVTRRGSNILKLSRSVHYRKDLLEGGEGVKRKLADLGEDKYHVGNDVSSAIKHEFGHLVACEAYCRKYGHEPESTLSFNSFNTDIVRSALGSDKYKMITDSSNKSMSKYGRTDDCESVAESWANPNYSAETRKIHDELVKYLRMENSVKPVEIEAGVLDVVDLCSGYPLDRTRIDEMCNERMWRESLNRVSNAYAEEKEETHSLVKMAKFGTISNGENKDLD